MCVMASLSRLRRNLDFPWFTEEELYEIARNLSATKAPSDPIRVRAMRKDTPHLAYRVIASYGLADSARQLLVKRAIEPLIKSSDTQFGIKGRGRNEAIRYLRTLIQEHGSAYALACDVTSFYPSNSKEWLKANLKLIIGEGITQSTILIGDDRMVIPSRGDHSYRDLFDDSALVSLGRSGLPQGSRTSNAVATHVVASVLEQVQLPEGVPLVGYADDFALLGRTEREVMLAFEVLQHAFACHPAGNFTIKDAPVVSLRHGLDFLGYRINTDDAGAVHVSLPESKMAGFTQKLLIKLNEMETWRTDFSSFERWLYSYIEAHAEDDGELMGMVFSELDTILELHIANLCFEFHLRRLRRMIYSMASERMGDSLAA